MMKFLCSLFRSFFEDKEFSGYGAVPGETKEQFHARMADCPTAERVLNEMQLALQEASQSVI